MATVRATARRKVVLLRRGEEEEEEEGGGGRWKLLVVFFLSDALLHCLWNLVGGRRIALYSSARVGGAWRLCVHGRVTEHFAALSLLERFLLGGL